MSQRAPRDGFGSNWGAILGTAVISFAASLIWLDRLKYQPSAPIRVRADGVITPEIALKVDEVTGIGRSEDVPGVVGNDTPHNVLFSCSSRGA